ncbi:MAG: nucleoside deaminase [Bdellovibrionales bacterium]|nr:nucleoside deaminase [Bdellovibrionales bacterium]
MHNPSWVEEFVRNHHSSHMDLAVGLAAENVKQRTGGPFGAVLVNEKEEILSVGVNIVVQDRNPIAHAEIVAIVRGAHRLQQYDLSQCVLYASGEPCAMCAGAIHWAGIRSLHLAALSEDIETIAGFHEGPRLKNWREWFVEQGGTVVHDRQCEQRAKQVLATYRDLGEVIYNS